MTKEEKKRLNAIERKRLIVESVTPLFAKKGFSATTTKDLAKAAGVSEALLYKHFPSKESLFAEIQDSCCRISESKERLSQLKPSTETLILLIHICMARVFLGEPGEEKESQVLRRLMVNSILDDGNFAQVFISRRMADFLPTIQASMQAAKKEKSLISNAEIDLDSFWFLHHVALGMGLFDLNDKKIVPYVEKQKQERLYKACLFALRGIGLKESVIKKYYQFDQLYHFERTLQSGS